MAARQQTECFRKRVIKNVETTATEQTLLETKCEINKIKSVGAISQLKKNSSREMQSIEKEGAKTCLKIQGN